MDDEAEGTGEQLSIGEAAQAAAHGHPGRRCAPSDTECLLMEIAEEEQAEAHLPLDGGLPEHWKHVESRTPVEDELETAAAREEHQERLARGRPRGKI